MEQRPKQSTENFIKEIRRKTRRLFSSEQKLVIVMEAQRGEYSIAELWKRKPCLYTRCGNSALTSILQK